MNKLIDKLNKMAEIYFSEIEREIQFSKKILKYSIENIKHIENGDKEKISRYLRFVLTNLENELIEKINQIFTEMQVDAEMQIKI